MFSSDIKQVFTFSPKSELVPCTHRHAAQALQHCPHADDQTLDDSVQRREPGHRELKHMLAPLCLHGDILTVPVEARLLYYFKSGLKPQISHSDKTNTIILLTSKIIRLIWWLEPLEFGNKCSMLLYRSFCWGLLGRDRAQKQACVLQARCSWLCEYANVYTNHHSGPCALQPAANDTQSLCHGKTCGRGEYSWRTMPSVNRAILNFFICSEICAIKSGVANSQQKDFRSPEHLITNVIGTFFEIAMTPVSCIIHFEPSVSQPSG